MKMTSINKTCKIKNRWDNIVKGGQYGLFIYNSSTDILVLGLNNKIKVIANENKIGNIIYSVQPRK